MKMIRRRFTYANVMATIAAFLALGGVGYAAAKIPAGSVGTKQLAKGAVTGAKVKDGTITGAQVKDGSLGGADIDAASLGTVPSATHAVGADTATTAGHATTADRATQAVTATRAAEATHAETADTATAAISAEGAEKLDGNTATQIVASAKPSCPSGTHPESGLCFEVTLRKANLLISAMAICAGEGRWLPDVEQIISFQEHNYAEAQPEEWSNELYSAEGVDWGYTVARTEQGGASIAHHKASESRLFRCVVGPS